MADNERGDQKDEEKQDQQRPTSAGSKESGGSKKSIGDAVSKLTVKALKDFRLSDPSDADTTVTGGESEVPTANFNVDLPSLGFPEGGQTLLSDNVDFGAGIADTDDGDVGEEEGEEGGHEDQLSDDDSEGESEMVVLDPDHVSLSLYIYHSLSFLFLL